MIVTQTFTMKDGGIISNYDHLGNYQEIDPYANYNHPSSFNQPWSHEPDLFQPPPQNSSTFLQSLVNSFLINSLQFQ